MGEPRSTWKGLLKISLASIPVRLFSAEDASGKVAFHQYHTCHPSQPELGAPIERLNWCAVCQKKVAATEIHRGYEHERGKHVVITDDDIDSVKARASSDLVITGVTTEPIDPIFIDSTLMVVPEKGCGTDFEAVRQGLGTRLMLGTIVLREKPWHVALEADDCGMVLYRLRSQSQVRSWEKVMPPVEALPPSPQAVRLAKNLLSSMTTSFNYADLRNERDEALLALIAAKARGEVVTPLPTVAATASLSLMDALAQSLRIETAKRITPTAANQAKVRKSSAVSRRKKTA